MRGFVLTLCIAACCCFTAAADKPQPEITLPSVIGDHMVLQQDNPAPIWGKTDPKIKVTVTLGDVKKSVKSDEQGKWRVDLGPLRPGGPYELTVKAKKTKAVVQDVLVGEVWVCSGQSNMEWPVSRALNPEEEIKNANYPNMRLFTVKKKVSGEPLDGCEGSWSVCTPETIPNFSAVGYFFGRRVHETLKVPVGLINTSWGGTPSESWTSMPKLQSNPDFKPILDRWTDMIAKYPQAKAEFDAAMAEWQKKADEAKAKNEPEPKDRPREPMGPEHPWRAAGLYNGMIQPLIPFGIRGAIWYQGESNAGRAYQYRSLFPAMIEDWRANWNQGEFPFFFVQLANFMKRNPDANAPSAWAELREAQSMTLGLENTGQAVIIDIGEADDIHPKNKQDVGARLSQAAWKVAYGMDSAVWSGPVYDSMRVDGAAIRIKFTQTNGGLVTNGGPIKGFAIAGEDQKFVWASATAEGDEVVVSAAEVAKPVAVRYGWGDNPYCNLYNGAGMPASPFRTDDWPGVTVNER
ncbi:MAG: sialate O-acetylesterase [Candidatus Hydrogenedentes bacterium]|nr:sialate O-acetylesterase [Candidatus Hydrogenedentota bacterium]